MSSDGRAGNIASAPTSSHGRSGAASYMPQKPSSGQGSRRSNQFRVPPLNRSGGGGAADRAGSVDLDADGRPSMISQRQRDALRVSAFGFSGPQPNSLSGDAARQGKGHQPVTKSSLHTTSADDADVVVTMPEKTSVRFHLCVQALSEGCVQSFMRLFYLSHREPVCVDALSQRCFAVPEGKLRWVQEQLSAIEALRRQSEFPDVLDLCKGLAEYFEGEGDMDEAAWHYRAAIRYAEESLDHALNYAACGVYAAFLDRRDQPHAAVEMYESMRTLAAAMKDEEREKAACLALVTGYRTLGDLLAKEGADPAEVKRYFQRSVRMAKLSGTAASEGEGYEALGRIHELYGQLSKALQFQQSFRQVAHTNSLDDFECRAALNVASLEERLGRNREATASLQEALALAKKLEDPAKVCRATMQLGEVHRVEGDSEAAMTCFREAFPPAFESGDQDLVDSVRVAMGFAAGEYYFGHAGGGRGYLPIVCNDVRAQLAWMGNGEL